MNYLLLIDENVSFMIALMWTFPILEKLGGLDTTFEKLRARGFPIKTKDALRMWRSPNRGVIPGDAAVELMRMCEEEGIDFSADDFKLVRRPQDQAAWSCEPESSEPGRAALCAR